MSKAADRTQRQLLELLKLPGNDACADCRSRNPRWASWDHGIFICVQCAGIHRKMGTHISKVKSLTLDTWSREQVEHMRTHGNTKSNDVLNPGSAAQPPPSSVDEGERESQLEKFIRDKYEYRSFVGTAPPTPRSAPIASSAPTTTPSAAPLLAKPPPQQQRRGSSPAAESEPSQPTRSSNLPSTSTLAFADEPAPSIPPRPFANAPIDLPPSPEGGKHVRFRSTSVPIPDTDMPLRVPSAAGENRQPAKGILRPRSALSASVSTPGVSSVSEDWKGMNWGGSAGVGGGSTLGMGLPNGVQGQGRTPSSASTASFASMLSQGSAMSNGSMFSNDSSATTLSSLGGPSAYGGATNPFTGAPMTPGYQQQATYGQPLRAFSSSPAPTPAPAPAPPPPQPQRLNSSIWDDLDFLGGVSPSASSPAPPPQRSSTLYLSAQQPSFASSSSPSQARTSSPFAAPSTSSSAYNSPSPAPLRPQLTGFVPSSQFGQQMASELPNAGSTSTSAPFLQPQQTGYTPSSSLLSSLQTGSSHLSPLRPQQTGFAPPPSHSPLPNAPAPPSASPFAPLPPQQQQQQHQNSFFHSQSQQQQPSQYQPQPSPLLPSPSPSSFQPQQLQLQSTSTNPFHSSMLSASPLLMGSLGNALPQVQTPMQTAGGTNPFFSSYQSQSQLGVQPMRSQATGMSMSNFGGGGVGGGGGGGGSFTAGGMGGGYGVQPQMQQPMPTGMQAQQQQHQFQSTNPFFGFGGAPQGQQQGQYGRPWGS